MSADPITHTDLRLAIAEAKADLVAWQARVVIALVVIEVWLVALVRLVP